MKEYLKVKVMSLVAERRIIKTQADRIAERLNKRRAIVDAGNPKRNGEGLDTMKLHNIRDWKACEGLREHNRALYEECRTTHLAYGFVKGRDYGQMEALVRHPKKKLTEAELSKIWAMVKKYDERDPRTVAQKWEAFKQASANVPVKEYAHGSAQARKAAYHARPKRTKSERLAQQLS